MSFEGQVRIYANKIPFANLSMKFSAAQWMYLVHALCESRSHIDIDSSVKN